MKSVTENEWLLIENSYGYAVKRNNIDTGIRIKSNFGIFSITNEDASELDTRKTLGESFDAAIYFWNKKHQNLELSS